MTPVPPEEVAAVAAEVLRTETHEPIVAFAPLDKKGWRKGRAIYRAATANGSYIVKLSTNREGHAPQLLKALAGLPRPCYRVPRFIGHHDNVAVWEFRLGEVKELGNYTQHELDRLIAAVATTDAIANPPDSLRKTYLMKPIADTLIGRAQSDPKFAKALPELRDFAAYEDLIIGSTRFSHITHNDLTGANVILAGKRIYLIDWDSVSLGPPGASFRTMGDWTSAKRKWVAARYAHHSAKAGLEIGPEAILFAMQTHQMFWALETSARLTRLNRLSRGLRMFRRLRAKFDDINGTNA